MMKFALTLLAALSCIVTAAPSHEDLKNQENAKKRFLKTGEKKNQLAGNYFSTYEIALGVGGPVVDSAYYMTVTGPLDAFGYLYEWKECFSQDGGTTFTDKQSGTLVMTGTNSFYINSLTDNGGFAFIGDTLGSGVINRMSLLDFNQANGFSSSPTKTETLLGSDACPLSPVI